MPSPPVARAVISPRRNEWGEWTVRAYDASGRRVPSADYFTDDRGDAEATALAMVRPSSPALS